MFQLQDAGDYDYTSASGRALPTKAKCDLEKVKGLTFCGRMKLYCLGAPLVSRLCGCCRTPTHDEQLKIISRHEERLAT